MNKIEILIVCSTCNHTRKKSYTWLSEKHLPCPGCGSEVKVNRSHISVIKMKMQDALKEMDTLSGTRTISLRL